MTDSPNAVPVPMPPVPVEPQATAYSVQQFTQVNTAIPAGVWTTEALMDLHKRQQEVIDNNVRSLDDQRKRENKLNWAGVLLVSIIILFGLYLVAISNPFGKDIIGATVLFLSGYMAGRGSK